MLVEEYESVDQQVVEIHSISLQQASLISGVYLRYGWHASLGISLQCTMVYLVLVGGDEMVFRHRDTIVYRCRLVLFLVEVELFYYAFDERPRVGLVVNGEVGLIADERALYP